MVYVHQKILEKNQCKNQGPKSNSTHPRMQTGSQHHESHHGNMIFQEMQSLQQISALHKSEMVLRRLKWAWDVHMPHIFGLKLGTYPTPHLSRPSKLLWCKVIKRTFLTIGNKLKQSWEIGSHPNPTSKNGFLAQPRGQVHHHLPGWRLVQGSTNVKLQ